jgi:hypothetical protein
VIDSPWPQRLEDYNRQQFPTSSAQTTVRHFGVSCHESLGEFLATVIRIELWPDPFEEGVREALRRVLEQVIR